MRPSKRAFEKYKPRGIFSEFYGMLCNLQGAGFLMGSKVSNFTFVVVIFPIATM